MKNEFKELIYLIEKLGNFLNRGSRFSKINTTPLQEQALREININPNLTMSELCSLLQISLSSSTQLVNRLANQGLAKRTFDKKDRRIIRLTLSPAGENELKKMREAKYSNLEKILSSLPDKDVKELLRIHKSLGEILKVRTNETHK